MESYLNHLQRHQKLIASAAETLHAERPHSRDFPAFLSWIGTTLSESRAHSRLFEEILAHHGKESHPAYETISSMINTVVGFLPHAETPKDVLEGLAAIAGDIARKDVSLAVLVSLAERLGFTDDAARLGALRGALKTRRCELNALIPALIDGGLARRRSASAPPSPEDPAMTRR